MLPRLAADADRPRSGSSARPGPPPAVEHDHIVPIYQVGEDRGVPFLAMPFLQAASRSTTGCGREPPLPDAEVLRIGRETGRGAGRGPRARADPPRHQAGQRLARRATRAASRSSTSASPGPADDGQLTQDGRDRRHAGVHGPGAGAAASRSTPAPTCSASASCSTAWRPASCRSRATTPCSTLLAVTTEDPAPPTGIAPDLAALIMRLLAKRPDDRPPSAREVMAALSSAICRRAASIASRHRRQHDAGVAELVGVQQAVAAPGRRHLAEARLGQRLEAVRRIDQSPCSAS